MNEPLFFDDLVVGKSWNSRGRTVTEADIVNFACQSGDLDPLHVDHEFAKQTPFRKPIAHGLLGLSWVAGLASMFPAVNTLAFLSISQWDFHRPIHVGDTLSVINEVADLCPKGRRRGQVKWRRRLINQAGETVQSGFFETLVACRTKPSSTRSHAEPLRGPHTAAKRNTRASKNVAAE